MDTPETATVEVTQAEYLIRKNGYWYRPNAQGYTIVKAEAGRFTLDEAIRYSHPNGPDGPRDGISYELAPAAQDRTRATRQDGLPHDLFSHRAAWRRALVIVTEAASPPWHDVDDRAYWQHEIDVFDHVFAALSDSSTRANDEPPKREYDANENPFSRRRLYEENQRLKAQLATRQDGLREALPRRCDGIEQPAFEEWAKMQHFDMTEHPLHYLFLDPKTDAAREAWTAGLKHASGRIAAALSDTPPPDNEETEALRGEIERLREALERIAESEEMPRIYAAEVLAGGA